MSNISNPQMNPSLFLLFEWIHLDETNLAGYLSVEFDTEFVEKECSIHMGMKSQEMHSTDLKGQIEVDTCRWIRRDGHMYPAGILTLNYS